jgi:hypothetical protein
MSVLGIDLAAGASKTYACVLDDDDGALRAELFAGCDDDRLLALAEGREKVAIDSPFGWPRAFVDALAAHRRFEAWPAPDNGPPETFRAALSFRATDRVVMQTRRPLSVSTDKLGVTAMRCAHLLHRWSSAGEPVDRTGGGRFVEVYPAGALVRWGRDASGYKGSDTAALGTLLSAVSEAVPSLGLSAVDRELCASVHDAFDALVAALVGRAALLGLTDLPPPAVREQAAEEGWIHLPLRGSLPLVARSRSQLRCAPAEALSRRLAEPAHSSGCLAANVFGPWLSVDEPVPFHEESFAGETHLEVKCSSGLPGTPPTLDCVVDGPRVLAVESKCTETFAPHHADFKPAYRDVVAALADETWRAEYERLAEDPRRYRFLDAAQLVKHYLGLRRRFADRPITLAYLYWQPSNATDIAPCMIHAAELAEFSQRVGDPGVRFVGMSYAQLWDDWAGDGRPVWLREHVAALRQRYDVAV